MCVYIYNCIYIMFVCVCVCVCMDMPLILDIFNIFLCNYLWFNMGITTIGSNKMLIYKILRVLNKS